MGDASDNIPGIAGVGEKTALKLLNEYDKLENVLDNADAIKGKLGERVRAGAQTARLSKELATIDRDAPVRFDRQTALLPAADRFAPAFRRLGFRTLLERLPEEARAAAGGEEAGAAFAPEEELGTAEAVASFIQGEIRAVALLRTTAGGRRASPCRGTCSRPGWTSARRSRPCSPCSRAARRSACSTSRDGGRTLRTWASPWRRPIWTCASRGT